MAEAFPHIPDNEPGSEAVGDLPVDTAQLPNGPQPAAISTDLPKGLNQYDHLERVVTKNGAERMYGVDEEGKKHIVSHDYVLRAYGHDPSGGADPAEQSTAQPDIYEEYNQAVASNTDNAKDKTFREWVKADEIKKAAKWYTKTRAHGEAPDEIDPDVGPSDDEIKGLMNKDHQERLNAREGRSNPTEDDVAYYKWLKSQQNQQKETGEGEQQPEPNATDPDAPTETLPIDKTGEQLKQEIIKTAFADEDKQKLLIDLYKSYSDYQIARQESTKKKRPRIIDFGPEKTALDKYVETRKNVATYLKHQLEAHGIRGEELADTAVLEADLEKMAKEVVVGVTMQDKIDRILEENNEDSKKTEAKVPSPTEDLPKINDEEDNVEVPEIETEVKEPEPKTEAKWVYSPDEVIQKMVDFTEKFKNKAVVPTPEEYAEIRKVADHIDRQTVSSNSGRDMTAYHFIGDENQSFAAVLAKPFFDMANPLRWQLPKADLEVYEAFIDSGGMDRMPERYESGKRGALMTRTEFAKLREEALSEDDAAKEAKGPKEKAAHVQADYLEYIKNNLALSDQAKKLIPNEKDKGRLATLVKRIPKINKRSISKPFRR